MDANLTGLFLFNFESTSCKNHSDTNLVKIHSAVIEILSFSCSALFLVTAAILESQTAKKIQQIHTRNILVQRRINFNQWFLRYCHFRVYAIFSNSPWRPSWILNLHKYEIVPFRDHCDQIWTKYIHVFLRYGRLSKIGLVKHKVGHCDLTLLCFFFLFS